MSEQPSAGARSTVVPKPGVKTSSFYVWLATLIVGGLFTYLVRRGLVNQADADAHRGILVDWLARALPDLLPMIYFYVVGKLGVVFMRGRQAVTEAKAAALKQIVTAKTDEERQEV